MTTKIKTTLVLTASLFFYLTSTSQNINPDFMTLTNSYTLQGDSDVDFNTTSFTFTPIKKRFDQGRQFLNIGFNFDYSAMSYEDNVPFANTSFIGDLEDFQTFGISVFYVKALNQKWSVGAYFQPQLSSNFTSDLTIDDVNPVIAAAANYTPNDRSRLTFVAAYVPRNGLGIPVLPIVTYWKKLGQNMEMNLGFPEISLTYNQSSKTSFKTGVNFTGLNYNLSENFIYQGEEADHINANELTASLGVNHQLTEELSFSARAGYALWRTFEFTGDSPSDSVLELDMENNFNINFGIQFNPKRKK